MQLELGVAIWAHQVLCTFVAGEWSENGGLCSTCIKCIVRLSVLKIRVLPYQKLQIRSSRKSWSAEAKSFCLGKTCAAPISTGAKRNLEGYWVLQRCTI